MAMATMRKVALAVGGVAALVAAVVAAALISLLVNSPDQVALAMSDGDFFDLVSLIFQRVASVCVRVLKLL